MPSTSRNDDVDRAASARRSTSGRSVSAAAPVIFVPGLRNSGPDHWQTHWQMQVAGATRVEQPDWNSTDLDLWAETVAAAVADIDRPLVIAHSFGCFAVLAAVARGANIGGALLVAPADLGRYTFDDRIPWRKLEFPTTLVASTDDPWIKLTRAGELASLWGSRLVVYRDAGHINVESGHGPWPDGLKLLEDLRLQRGDQQLQPRDAALDRGERAPQAPAAADDLERNAV
jgi:predicted alpha/beta hydrolase family esterase